MVRGKSLGATINTWVAAADPASQSNLVQQKALSIPTLRVSGRLLLQVSKSRTPNMGCVSLFRFKWATEFICRANPQKRKGQRKSLEVSASKLSDSGRPIKAEHWPTPILGNDQKFAGFPNQTGGLPFCFP